MDKKQVHKLVGDYLIMSVSNGATYGNEFYTSFRDNESGIEGFTKKLDNVFLLIFKATNESKDWITDLSAWDFKRLLVGFFGKKSYPYGDPSDTKIRIHDAYVKGYLKVKKEIQDAYIASGCNEICVIGYSMGAGLAPIAALDLQYNNNLAEDKIGCGIGDGPRVFNKAGADSFNRRVPNACRYKYGNDLVAKVPPAIFGFRHVGEYHHLGPKEHWFQFSVLDHACYSMVAQYAKELAEK